MFRKQLKQYHGFSKNRCIKVDKGNFARSSSCGWSCFSIWVSSQGDARADSDWDVLILLDKPKIEDSDYDTISYPLVELGWLKNECISPVLYTLKDWLKYHFTPFFHNVKTEGIQLI